MLWLGNVAGVLAMQTSGQPGKILRNSGFVVFLLSELITRLFSVLVDGFERSLDEINSEVMLNRFTVLKDASTTAIYGPRGANGVVLITTKTW